MTRRGAFMTPRTGPTVEQQLEAEQMLMSKEWRKFMNLKNRQAISEWILISLLAVAFAVMVVFLAPLLIFEKLKSYMR